MERTITRLSWKKGRSIYRTIGFDCFFIFERPRPRSITSCLAAGSRSLVDRRGQLHGFLFLL